MHSYGAQEKLQSPVLSYKCNIFIISYTVLKLHWHVINRVTTDVHSNPKTNPSPVSGFVIVFTLAMQCCSRVLVDTILNAVLGFCLKTIAVTNFRSMSVFIYQCQCYDWSVISTESLVCEMELYCTVNCKY